MTEVILASFTAYIGACVIGASSLFEPVREKVKKKFPKLKIGNNKHFIECRLCLTAYASCFAILLFNLPWQMVLPVYGLAYFMATQER